MYISSNIIIQHNIIYMNTVSHYSTSTTCLYKFPLLRTAATRRLLFLLLRRLLLAAVLFRRCAAARIFLARPTETHCILPRFQLYRHILLQHCASFLHFHLFLRHRFFCPPVPVLGVILGACDPPAVCGMRICRSGDPGPAFETPVAASARTAAFTTSGVAPG